MGLELYSPACGVLSPAHSQTIALPHAYALSLPSVLHPAPAAHPAGAAFLSSLVAACVVARTHLDEPPDLLAAELSAVALLGNQLHRAEVMAAALCGATVHRSEEEPLRASARGTLNRRPLPPCASAQSRGTRPSVARHVHSIRVERYASSAPVDARCARRGGCNSATRSLPVSRGATAPTVRSRLIQRVVMGKHA